MSERAVIPSKQINDNIQSQVLKVFFFDITKMEMHRNINKYLFSGVTFVLDCTLKTECDASSLELQKLNLKIDTAIVGVSDSSKIISQHCNKC